MRKPPDSLWGGRSAGQVAAKFSACFFMLLDQGIQHENALILIIHQG